MQIRIMFLLSILALGLFIAEGKIIQNDYTFSYLRRNKGWIFLQRMKIGQGYGQVRFNTKLSLKDAQPSKTYSLQLSIIPDSLWDREVMMKCSKDTNSLSDLPIDNTAKQYSLTTNMTPQNKFNSGVLNTFSVEKQQTYHFVLKDCQKQLLNEYFSRDSRLEIQLEIKNNGKDYGEDQANNFFYFPILILGTIIMLKFIDKKQILNNSNVLDSKDTDYVKILVVSCIWLNLISLIFKYTGYLIYIYFGNDYSFFEFMYLFFHSLADSIIVSILLFVAFGWTITFVRGRDFDLYVPLVCMMGLISLILTLLNKVTDGSHDKYHMYDTIPAYIFAFFKFINIIIFVIGCIKTYFQVKNNPKVRVFMIQILIIGGLYIISVPIIMLLVTYVPASERKQWVFLLIQLIKNFICVLMSYMISVKKSGYQSISYAGKSFMEKDGAYL